MKLLSFTLAALASSAAVVADNLTISDNLLYSPINAQKLLAMANDTTALNSGWYPEYTTRDGQWVWFAPMPDGWTAGLFPAALYVMQDRERMCPALATGTDWLSLARQWTAPLLKQLTGPTVLSSLGFLSYPFQYELIL
jgi:hypothetical protein